MPHVVAHAMMSCMHHTACACRQATCHYEFMACQKLIIKAKALLLKLTASHFNALNMKDANQNMMERILIAM